MNKKYDRIEFRGKGTPDDWLWCIHCERAYQLKDCREVDGMFGKLQMCHYEDCDGDTVLDAWNWYEHHEIEPQKNKHYPLYPDNN